MKCGEDLKFRLREATPPGLSKPAGQTALKELIVNVVNRDLNAFLDPSKYCVHHFNTDHSDYNPENVAITTYNNHNNITGLTEWCKWDELKKAISKCFVIKVHAQTLTDKDVDKIVNKLKVTHKLYIDSNKIYWLITNDNAFKYSARPLNINKGSDVHELGFESDDELVKHIKSNNWKKIR